MVTTKFVFELEVFARLVSLKGAEVHTLEELQACFTRIPVMFTNICEFLAVKHKERIYIIKNRFSIDAGILPLTDDLKQVIETIMKN